MKRILTALVLLVMLLAAAAACGDEEPGEKALTGHDKVVADGIAKGVRAATDLGERGQEPLISKDEAQCIGDKAVRTFGADTLYELDVVKPNGKFIDVTKHVGRPNARKWVATFGDCLDIYAFSVEQMRGLMSVMTDGKKTPDKMWDKVENCLRKRIDPKLMEAAQVEILLERTKSAPARRLHQSARTCAGNFVK